MNGSNYRLSDINCALGYSQIKKIDKIISKREKISKIYDKLFKHNSDLIKIQNRVPNQKSAWHLYIIIIDFLKLKINRSVFIKKLFQKQIITQVHYIPIHQHPVFSALKNSALKNTNYYYNNCLSLPIYYDLKPSQQRYIVKTINFLIKKYRK